MRRGSVDPRGLVGSPEGTKISSARRGSVGPRGPVDAISSKKFKRSATMHSKNLETLKGLSRRGSIAQASAMSPDYEE